MLSVNEKWMLVNFWFARCTLKYFSRFMCKLWNQVFRETQLIAPFGCGLLVPTERERGTSRREHWERGWRYASKPSELRVRSNVWLLTKAKKHPKRDWGQYPAVLRRICYWCGQKSPFFCRTKVGNPARARWVVSARSPSPIEHGFASSCPLANWPIYIIRNLLE